MCKIESFSLFIIDSRIMNNINELLMKELKREQVINNFRREECKVKLKHILLKKIDYINKQTHFYKHIDMNNITKIILRVSRWAFCNGVTNNSIIVTYKKNKENENKNNKNTQTEYKINAEETEFLFIFNHCQSYYNDKKNDYTVIHYL